MDTTTSIAAAAAPEENRGAAANSTNYPKRAATPTIAAATDALSSVPLGTPQERIEILFHEFHQAQQAGVIMRWQVQYHNGEPYTLVQIRHCAPCPVCGNFAVTGQCESETCARYHKPLPQPQPA